MFDLTGFQRDLLYTIASDDGQHGLAIKDKMETYYQTDINHARLYPNLDALAEKGLIEKSQRDERTNEYDLTARGARKIETRVEWEQQYVDR